jgi:hypothetical protein
MTKVNQLCHQIAAARSIVREQLERAAALEAQIADIVGVSVLGGYVRVAVEDFEIEVARARNHSAHVYMTPRSPMVGELAGAAGVATASAEG